MPPRMPAAPGDVGGGEIDREIAAGGPDARGA